MFFTSIRIITEDVKRLVHFYQQVTGMPATQYNDDFAEINLGSFTIAIGSTRTLQLFGGNEVARPASNQSVIIEFRVADVDSVYEKLAQNIVIVQEPTTMPWGNRSLLFRDPDGNLVNFFTPVTKEALAKFNA